LGEEGASEIDQRLGVDGLEIGASPVMVEERLREGGGEE
jgi:hypothetical protein